MGIVQAGKNTIQRTKNAVKKAKSIINNIVNK